MKNILYRFLKPSLVLISIFLLSVTAGLILFHTGLTGIKPAESSLLSFAFALLNSITILIFLKGRDKDGREGAMHTMVAISVKFLAEMATAIIWFIAAKKTGMDYIILFFVLYLTFSLCTIIILLNILKKKSL